MNTTSIDPLTLTAPQQPTSTCRRRFAVSGIFILLFTGVLFTPTAAVADSVVLKNGDTLTGQLVSGTGSDLVINSALAGRVSVKWTSIAQVTSTTRLRATLTDGRTIDGTLALANGRVTMQPSGGGAPVAIELASLQGIGPESSSNPAWNGAMNVGSNVSRGNSETSTLVVYSTATRKGPRDRLGLSGSFLRSTDGVGADAITTARSARGAARYDHDLSGSLFGFGFTEVANDPIQLLELRTVIGGGVGTHVAKTAVTQINFYGGLSYARDVYTDTTTITTTTTTTTTAGRSGRVIPQKSGTPPSVVNTSLSRSVVELPIGQDLTHQFSDTVSLSEALQVAPAVNDFKNYRVTFDLSLSAQLNGWLQWNLR